MNVRTGFAILALAFCTVADARDAVVKMDPALCVATTDACVPNQFALMATPEIYDGYLLELDGFVSWGVGGVVFYVDSEQACNQIRGAGLELHPETSMPSRVGDLLSSNGVVRVRVSGILDANSRGDRGGHVAVLTRATINISRDNHLPRIDPTLITRENDISTNFLLVREATCN